MPCLIAVYGYVEIIDKVPVGIGVMDIPDIFVALVVPQVRTNRIKLYNCRIEKHVRDYKDMRL